MEQLTIDSLERMTAAMKILGRDQSTETMRDVVELLLPAEREMIKKLIDRTIEQGAAN